MGSIPLGALPFLLAAQASGATVSGTVRDGESGRAIAGAVVALADLDRTTLTDRSGRYLLAGVPPGPQHLTVRTFGYASRTLHALVPRDGTLDIHVVLRPAPIPLAGLEVRTGVPVPGVEEAAEAGLGDAAGFPDRALSLAAVRNHPQLAEPDVFQALSGGEVVLDPESPSGVHVRGGASEHTAYLLDGIPVLSPYHAAGVFSAFSPDALARIDLFSFAPSPALPDALSGAVSAVTRTPGERPRARGSASSTQARATVDGPLGRSGGGWMLSGRMGLPDLFAPGDEASYVRGESSDWLAKVESPALGGRLRLLGYWSGNEFDAAAFPETEEPPGPPAVPRNAFEWESRSLGLSWTRSLVPLTVRAVAWQATSDAEAAWAPGGVERATPAEGATVTKLLSTRRDLGLLASVEHRAGDVSTLAGLRLERRRMTYDLGSDAAGGPAFRDAATQPVGTAFFRHARPITSRSALEIGLAAAAAAGGVHPGPRVALRYRAAARLALSAGYARTHQLAQSLRNPESAVGALFPADLYLPAGMSGVPVARSDQSTVAAEWRPLDGLRLTAQAYARVFDGLALVPPRSGEPFATDGFEPGSGTARGLGVEVGASGARYGLLATWGWQRVRLQGDDGDPGYIPRHGAAHLVEAGAILYPTATTSFRVGASGAFGRRGTAVAGGLEWEACNLLDQGCEFAGSPRYDPAELGAAELPGYLRVDVGVRQHWHLEIAGRDASLGLFATLTNLLGRRNVLTYAEDPDTGEPVAIEMRPRAPLVVGLDWRF